MDYLELHRRSSHTRGRRFVIKRKSQQGVRPQWYKEYGVERVPLPQVEPRSAGLDETIRARRSVRDYSGEPLSLEELTRLLFHATGLTGLENHLRVAPTAGGLTPIEAYPVVNYVQGLERGLYHYHPLGHHLHILREGDLRGVIAKVCLDQGFLSQAGVVLVLTAVHRRTAWKYGERAYRYVLLDAGHAAQNIQLQAASLGLGACPIGAFFDEELNRLLDLEEGEEFAVLALSVGRPA